MASSAILKIYTASHEAAFKNTPLRTRIGRCVLATDALATGNSKRLNACFLTARSFGIQSPSSCVQKRCRLEQVRSGKAEGPKAVIA